MRGGRVQQRRYGCLGQVLIVHEPTDVERHFAYDASGKVTQASDGRREATGTYSAIGQLAQQQDGQTVQFAYAPSGYPTSSWSNVARTVARINEEFGVKRAL